MVVFIFTPDNSMREMDIPESLKLESLRQAVLSRYQDLDKNIKLIYDGTMFGGEDKDKDMYTWELGIGDRHLLYVWDPNGPKADEKLHCLLQLPGRRLPVWDGTFSSEANAQDCDNLELFFNQRPSEFYEFRRAFPQAALAMHEKNLDVWFKNNRPGVAEIEKYMAKYFENSDSDSDEMEEPADCSGSNDVSPNPFEPSFYKDEDYEVQLAIEESIALINYMAVDEPGEIEKEQLKEPEEEEVNLSGDDEAQRELKLNLEGLPMMPLDVQDWMIKNPQDVADDRFLDFSKEEQTGHILSAEDELMFVREEKKIEMSFLDGWLDELSDQSGREDDGELDNSLVEEATSRNWKLGLELEEIVGYDKPSPFDLSIKNFDKALKAAEEASKAVIPSQEGASAAMPSQDDASEMDDHDVDEDPDEVFEGAASLPLVRGMEKRDPSPELRFKAGSYLAHMRRSRGAGMRGLELLKKTEPMVPPEKMNGLGKMPYHHIFRPSPDTSSPIMDKKSPVFGDVDPEIVKEMEWMMERGDMDIKYMELDDE